MGGLQYHAMVEEQSLFPKLMSTYPKVDLKFLYEEHGELHTQEQKLMEAFGQSLENLLMQIVDFDRLFMAHLGEEEDVVTPMMLVTIIRF